MSDLTLTMAEIGATLSLPKGDTIALRLPEISGTAFLWHLRNPDRFEITSDTYETTIHAPGGESLRLLSLHPKATGTQTLRLDRYRPWEDASQADADFEVTIRIDPGSDPERIAP